MKQSTATAYLKTMIMASNYFKKEKLEAKYSSSE
jgi:hypothetical protein